MKFLLINLAYIGDVILTGPVVRAIGQRFSAAVVDMLVVPPADQIARLLPGVNKVWGYDKRGQDRGWRRGWQLCRAIRRESYDVAICSNFAVRGAVLSRLSGVPRRIGYDLRLARWLLTDLVSPHRPAGWHEARKQLAILKPLGIDGGDDRLALSVGEGLAAAAAARLGVRPGDYVVLCPYGSYPRKQWREENYRQLLGCLAGCGLTTVLVGDRRQKAQLEGLAAGADWGRCRPVVAAGSLDLAELAGLISRARLVVSIDTGPMHIAEALGVPLVAIFGPTDPFLWGPRGPGSTVVYRHGYCQPCYNRRACPGEPCLSGLPLAAVWSEVEKKLG
ncbi:MAG: glycosyltransferase family 9 protein [Negativicutes bacterium]|nr:glycosyltransferase family 9 protein [Negativicutes bacterium]